MTIAARISSASELLGGSNPGSQVGSGGGRLRVQSRDRSPRVIKSRGGGASVFAAWVGHITGNGTQKVWVNLNILLPFCKLFAISSNGSGSVIFACAKIRNFCQNNKFSDFLFYLKHPSVAMPIRVK